MSFRRSPLRTRALLAANRVHSQKSTGPRTAPGKQRSAAKLLRCPAAPAGTGTGRRGASLRDAAYSSPEAQKTPLKAHRQTRNVEWTQMDSRIFGKMTAMRRTAFVKPHFLRLRIPLIPWSFIAYIAYTRKPTLEKRSKKTLFQTPTTEKAFLFRINNIPGMRRLAPKLLCPLSSTKRGLHDRES
jgi:hypothetical protein